MKPIASASGDMTSGVLSLLIYIYNLFLVLLLSALHAQYHLALFLKIFSPDYQKLRDLRHEFPTVPMMALTATATIRVATDIEVQVCPYSMVSSV